MGFVIVPFDRARMAERSRLDELDELDEVAAISPSERLADTLELSDFMLELSETTGTSERANEENSLEEKARLYARPLQLTARGCKRSSKER